jgi:predicted phosphodiesterase
MSSGSVDYAKVLADLKEPGERQSYKKKGKLYPDGWQPRSDVDTTTGGFIVSKPYEMGDEPENEAILTEFGYDPANWEIQSIRHRKWQVYDERWLESKRINIVPRELAQAERADVDEILKALTKWKPRTPPKKMSEASLFTLSGDVQWGKIQPGVGGTEQVIEFYFNEMQRTIARQKRIKAEQVVFAYLGDCIEGNQSQGGKVKGRTDLTMTQQTRILRRTAVMAVKAFASTTDHIWMPVVPGNHDEVDRSIHTEFTDSWAIEGISAAYDAINENPELKDRVSFLFPRRDHLSLTHEWNDVVVSMVHGHQFGGAKDSWKTWWDGQCSGRTPVADADLLISGHYHHLRIQDYGGNRLWIQQPALDLGSRWFTEVKGQHAPSRMVSFLTVEGRVAELDPVL